MNTFEKKTIAIYARYSSDKQSARSADDQLARCENFAADRGGRVEQWLRFKDEAVSGSSLKRPGFEAMMHHARQRHFQVLVVEDLDRLSRDMGDSAQIFKEMAFYDIEVIAAADGVSSLSPSAKTHFFLKGFMGEAFLDNLRDKTFRGLVGRFNAGFATGAVAYGFKTIPKLNAAGEVSSHEIVLDEEQARVVRQIFADYLCGSSLALLAAGLNGRGVPAPRSKKRTGTSAWNDSTVRSMLHNEVYAGKWSFGRRKWTKVPGTNTRRPKPRSESDRPVTQQRDHLRIIDVETWTAVQDRLAAVRSHFVSGPTNRRTIQGKPSQFPFSGLLLCDHCGSLMYIYGRGVWRRYRCTGNAKRGICANSVTVLESVVRGRLLAATSHTLTNEFGLAYARKVAAQQSGDLARSRAKVLKEKAAELTKVETRIGTLIDQMGDGAAADYVKNAIDELATKAKGLQRELAALKASSEGPVELPSPEVIRTWLTNLNRFVELEPLRAREYLRRLFKGSHIRLRVGADGIYMATGEILPTTLLTEKPPQGVPEEASFSSPCCGGRI